MCHSEQVPRDVDGIFEGHAIIVIDTTHKTLAYAQLPGYRLEPLLCDANFDCLGFCAFQISRYCFRELCLHLCEPSRIGMRVNLIPKVDKSVIDDSV